MDDRGAALGPVHVDLYRQEQTDYLSVGEEVQGDLTCAQF